MLFSFPAFAQYEEDEVPMFQVFGGFSFVYDDDHEYIDKGFVTSLEGRLTNLFGIVGEFSYYDSKASQRYSFMGGPRISYVTKDKIRPFAHVLAGGTYIDFDEYITFESETHFSIVYGGGVDFALNELISFRPAQFDVFSIKKDEMETSFRYAGGVILKF
jgi:hypothetical protein